MRYYSEKDDIYKRITFDDGEFRIGLFRVKLFFAWYTEKRLNKFGLFIQQSKTPSLSFRILFFNKLIVIGGYI